MGCLALTVLSIANIATATQGAPLLREYPRSTTRPPVTHAHQRLGGDRAVQLGMPKQVELSEKRTAARADDVDRLDGVPTAAQQWARIRKRIRMLQSHDGSLQGPPMIAHAFVVAIGLLGMFAAVTGAIVGQRLPETIDEGETFEYWADETDDESGYACPDQREMAYAQLRGGADAV